VSEKAERIKETLKATRERRKNQKCRVIRLKLDYSHLAEDTKMYLERLFWEAKWLHNHIIASGDIKNADYNVKTAQILKQGIPEDREIQVLSSQMRQSVADELKDNLKGLAASKQKGRKVGRLKFSSQCTHINLKQFGNTYKIEGNHLKLQGFKKRLRLQGIGQIPAGAEIANAKLVKKPSGYYLHVACFVERKPRRKTGKNIGLDFGIQTHIADSEGNRHTWTFPEPKRLKKLSRKLNRARVKHKKQQKKPKNHEKRRKKLALAYEKLGNKKQDAKNKFVSRLFKEYDLIAAQDESLAAWKSSKMRGWGTRIQYSIMGGIMRDLKRNTSQTLIVDKWFASTQTCPRCGLKHKMPLAEREYVCWCGYRQDRDIKAAGSILSEAIKQVNLRGAGTLNACGDEALCVGYGFAHTGVSLVCETRSPSL
jgi:transposase